jgi:hypothetical protein
MQFVWTPLLPTTVSPQGNSSASVSGSKPKRGTVVRFAEAEGLSIIAEYSKRKPAKARTRSLADRNSRPPAPPPKAAKCCVLVSKLDRLSHDVAFVAGLMAQRVP